MGEEKDDRGLRKKGFHFGKEKKLGLHKCRSGHMSLANTIQVHEKMSVDSLSMDVATA